MASVGMEGLQEFMVFPDNLDDILERLEHARQQKSTNNLTNLWGRNIRGPKLPYS